MTFAIDGLFLTQRITGIQRYGYEVCLELDKLVAKNELEIVVPEGTVQPFVFQNIKIVSYGKHKGILWEQLDFSRYLKKNKKEGVFFTNTVPLLYAHGIVAVHDVSYKANPQFFTSKRDRLSALWHRLQYWRIASSKMPVVTVSHFSKAEIQRYYKVSPERITVIYNAWQHMQRVECLAEMDAYFQQHRLTANQYCFAMSTLNQNKNFAWIVEAAKQNPQETFVLAGSGNLKNVIESEQVSNIQFLGYVSDEEAKCLMANCKAFLFPTLYEGFGIPPLEAIACGAQSIMVSDTACMHEVYQGYAHYANVEQPDYALDFAPCEGATELLELYAWEKSAKQWLHLLRNTL